MRKNVFIIFLLLVCSFLVIGCSELFNEEKEQETEGKEENEEEDGEEKEEENSDDSINGVGKVEEDESETDEKEDVEAMDDESEDDIELGDYEIYLGGEMIEEDDKIIIEGESNLLPDSRVVGEVSVGDLDEEEFFADTTELVEDDGSFTIEIEHHDLDEETNVAVKFDFDGQQDDEIKRHYGDRGQKLTGPYIYQEQGRTGGGDPQNIFNQARVTATFDPSEEKSIRQFKEPDWYEIPNDMGDPSVWMEVEEVTNEDEYYYVHGQSNLIEGSILRLDNEYKTKVMPDGSFDFKFPYEYREDEPFVIQFKPNHWSQWNIVEETYGEEGQKLVGDLVEVNKHGDDQFIELEVERESQEIDVPDNVDVDIDGTEVTMLVPEDVLFDFDKYDLKGDSKKVLTEISETIDTLEQEELAIEIHGHTDNVGKKDYNLELSEKRAEEVKDFLKDEIKDKDIDFETEGYGDKKSIASNDTEKGQAKNRRVEIVIHLR